MLPSQRTLRDYTYYTRACLGFSASVDRQMMDLAKIDSCRTLDKYVIVIMDEMHVKEDIVYDKHTGMYCIVLAILLHLHEYYHCVVGAIVGFRD